MIDFRYCCLLDFMSDIAVDKSKFWAYTDVIQYRPFLCAGHGVILVGYKFPVGRDERNHKPKATALS